MSGFDTFRRVWSLVVYGIFSGIVLTYMVTHIRRRRHIGVVQVSILNYCRAADIY